MSPPVSPMVVIPYVTRMSEDVRWKFNIRVVFVRVDSLLNVDQGQGQELLVKEALHIQMTPSEDVREEQSSPTFDPQ